MILSALKASSWPVVFGAGEPALIIIAQRPDCSAFLVLHKDPIDGLDAFESFDNFDFTYCQEWGLTINEDVVRRVIADIRAKSYPPKEDYLDAVAKDDQQAIKAYKDACLAVKARFPKRV